METILHLDLITLIKSFGLLGIFFMVFAESGLFFGFFFPGDSLLFTAGFLASQGYLNIFVLVIISFLGAVLGDNAGYAFGSRVGPKIFTKENSLFFKKEYIEDAKKFYEKHGKKTIILARFLPIIRTFAPIVAGVGTMHYPIFFIFNIIGGALWAMGIPLLGFLLGSSIPNIDRYLIPIIAFIIFISLLPTLIHINKAYRNGFKRS